MLFSFVNPFSNEPWFLRVCSTGLLKKLIKSNFPFSHSVFYLFGELSAIFIKFKIVGCKLFQFGRVWNLSFGKGLIIPGRCYTHFHDVITFNITQQLAIIVFILWIIFIIFLFFSEVYELILLYKTCCYWGVWIVGNQWQNFPIIDTQHTIFLLIRAPSLIVAPPPEKPLNQDNIMNTCWLK